MATMNISLPDTMKAQVDTWVAEGSFANSSEFLRSLLRDYSSKIEALNAALEEGEASPSDPEPFDGEAFLTEIKADFNAGR